MNNTGNRSGSRCTSRWPKRSFKKAGRTATLLRPRPKRARSRARAPRGCSMPECGSCRARRVTAVPPLLVATDGTKLSKRRHGPVVSVTTYRDAGFLPEAFINFLCLLGWSPKDDREKMSRQELIDAFSFEGINKSNAVVNFTETDPF